ncbi:hypothetical protein GCM10011579_094310 [Streptomyces albiflavescens]|uniref:Uncharacterized protein n=1 Tax=Streptomyces albiflavescens TaxID=1623582 RepID=A0A918DAC8_9ACTN|nr:hypothetical protein [Streptomyces albiflavescens]GGN94628.1 hypothetical protein GCM10011579_094310 [Streptomyces albiflavescens]
MNDLGGWDSSGEEALAAERQGNPIGVAPGFRGDAQHQGVQGSFGDIGNMVLKRGDETIGNSVVQTVTRAYDVRWAPVGQVPPGGSPVGGGTARRFRITVRHPTHWPVFPDAPFSSGSRSGQLGA